MRDLFCEAGEVDDLICFWVDVKVLDAGSKMVHELAQGSRRNGPVIGGLLFVKLGMDWRRDFERQPVLRGDTCRLLVVPSRCSRHESAYHF